MGAGVEKVEKLEEESQETLIEMPIAASKHRN